MTELEQKESKIEGLRIAISAGELSGDQQGAAVVSALRTERPDCVLRGMGGSSLRACGVDTIVDSEQAASLHGFNLLRILPRSIWAAVRMFFLLLRWKPHLLVIVDYPDFFDQPLCI